MGDKEARILEILGQMYPDASSELHFANEFQLICAVLLSAQCTDKKVNQVTPALFAKFPNFEALAKASQAEIEAIIRQVNYYRTKSKHLVLMASAIMQNFNGKLPRTHNELTSLAGVGRKTANVVLGELKIEPRLAVDTHVFRVARRLGLSRGKTVNQVEDSLTKRFPSETWRALHHGLILHGRRICKAQNPLCSSCALLKECPFGQRRIGKVTK